MLVLGFVFQSFNGIILTKVTLLQLGTTLGDILLVNFLCIFRLFDDSCVRGYV